MFAENISNVSILSVLELSWDTQDGIASPRPYHALSFRIKGNAEYKYKTEHLEVSTNDILFVPQNLGYHQIAKDEKLFCIHFLADNIPTDKMLKFIPTYSPVFEKLFSNMFDRWTHKSPGYYAGAISDFYKIISKIQRQQNETKLLSSEGNITASVQYIHQNFTDAGITIQNISKVSSLSESHFRKLFKNHFGISPLQYINNLRIEYATELIESGYYKVYEIAAMAGFTDVKYFSTVMKKATGKSPSELKK